MSLDHAKVKVSKRAALFTLLSDGAWHVHQELARVGGVRYSARLLELKREGYAVESEEVAEGDPGKRYRMPTTERGAAKAKKVKAYLAEEDVRTMVELGYIPPLARDALTDALGSFTTNRERL